MKELHLFAGIGGGIYGGMLLGHTCVGAIEIDEFCRKVLRQRQKDDWMEEFNIYGDLTKISGKEHINSFDILCGGFPCQAFSTAARGRNLQEKDLWEEMLRFIKESEAPIVFAENVTRKAIDMAKNDLEKIGYKVSIAMVSNNIVGANHQRNRFWALAVKEDKKNELIEMYHTIQKLPLLSGDFWAKEVDECGIVNEPIEKRKQLKGIGNAQSPIVVATAFRILTNRLYEKLTKKSYKEKKSIAPNKEELSKVFKTNKTWIDKKYGDDFGFVHTPTTMANYSAPSMMKHKGCRNFVEVFSKPSPENAEWLMGFPINASSPCSLSKESLDIWKTSILMQKG